MTHVGERWVDSGGESRAELSALKMNWIESTQQGKMLVNGCSQTKRYIFTSQFFLAFRSSCKQSVRGNKDTFALNILACENAASNDVRIFYTFRVARLPKPPCFQGVVTTTYTSYKSSCTYTCTINYRANITQQAVLIVGVGKRGEY